MKRRSFLVIPFSVAIVSLVGCDSKEDKQKKEQKKLSDDLAEAAKKTKPMQAMTVDLNKDKK